MFTEMQHEMDLFMWAMIALGFAVGLLVGYLLGFSDGKEQTKQGWIIKQKHLSRFKGGK